MVSSISESTDVDQLVPLSIDYDANIFVRASYILIPIYLALFL